MTTREEKLKSLRSMKLYDDIYYYLNRGEDNGINMIALSVVELVLNAVNKVIDTEKLGKKRDSILKYMDLLESDK